MDKGTGNQQSYRRAHQHLWTAHPVGQQHLRQQQGPNVGPVGPAVNAPEMPRAPLNLFGPRCPLKVYRMV